MDRRSLTDAQWAKMQPHCRGKVSDPGRTGGDNRLFLEAVLWISRTGSRWRDLPPEFGKWNTVFKRFRDWVKADVFKRIFDAVSDDPDMEYVMVDVTIVRAWIQVSSATFDLKAASSSAMASSGVFHPRVLRGRWFIRRATSLSSVWLMVLRSVPLGKNWRSRPLVFSLLPRCQGACGSQNQMSIFSRLANSGWQAISLPRS